MSTFKELEYEIAMDMHTAGLGVFSTANPASRTIYIGELPQDVTEAIMLINVPSPPPHQYIDTEYAIIDFWSRSPHTDRSKAQLRAVFERYHRRYHYDTGNWHVAFSQALGNIVDVDRDREGGKLYRLSVQFISRNLNHVS
jgi:hypothetical protein